MIVNILKKIFLVTKRDIFISNWVKSLAYAVPRIHINICMIILHYKKTIVTVVNIVNKNLRWHYWIFWKKTHWYFFLKFDQRPLTHCSQNPYQVSLYREWGVKLNLHIRSLAGEFSVFRFFWKLMCSCLNWIGVCIAKTASTKFGYSMKFISYEVTIDFCKTMFQRCMRFLSRVCAGDPNCYIKMVDKLYEGYFYLLPVLNLWLITEIWAVKVWCKDFLRMFIWTGWIVCSYLLLNMFS